MYYGNFYNPGLKFNYNKLLPVDYDIYVPTSYWVKGAGIVPEPTTERVAQLELFNRLYLGDYRDFLGDSQVVRMNYHKITTSFVSSLLMMNPPEIFMASGADLPVTGRFIAMLNKALRVVIADMVRYGTGLLRLSPGEYGAEVGAYNPVYWYPADMDSDTLAVPGQGYVELWHDLGRGEIRYERWETEGDVKGRMLGDRVDEETEQLGDASQWEAIQSLTLGRAGMIINVLADLPQGDWGQGIYSELTPLAIEVTHRLTQNKGTLDEHGNPMVVFKPDPSMPNTGNYRNSFDDHYGDGSWSKLQVQRTTDFNNAWRKRAVTNLPDGYADAEYLLWGGNLNDHFAQISKCEELLFAATRLPAAFFNIGPNGLPPSGVALDRQFIRTHAYVRDLISSLREQVYRAILVASMLNGSSAQEIETIYDDLEIEWKTIFDTEQEESEDVSPDVNTEEDSEQEDEVSDELL